MINQKLLEAAADWWAEQITGRKLNWDNGAQNEGSAEDRKMGSMMWMLGNLAAMQSRDKITDDQIKTFKKSLIEEIKKDAEKRDSVILAVDYHPERCLSEAARKAGIDEYAFPCKTVMWIDPNKVSAKLGYGAAEKIIATL